MPTTIHFSTILTQALNRFVFGAPDRPLCERVLDHGSVGIWSRTRPMIAFPRSSCIQSAGICR